MTPWQSHIPLGQGGTLGSEAGVGVKPNHSDATSLYPGNPLQKLCTILVYRIIVEQYAIIFQLNNGAHCSDWLHSVQFNVPKWYLFGIPTQLLLFAISFFISAKF